MMYDLVSSVSVLCIGKNILIDLTPQMKRRFARMEDWCLHACQPEMRSHNSLLLESGHCRKSMKMIVQACDEIAGNKYILLDPGKLNDTTLDIDLKLSIQYMCDAMHHIQAGNKCYGHGFRKTVGGQNWTTQKYLHSYKEDFYAIY